MLTTSPTTNKTENDSESLDSLSVTEKNFFVKKSEYLKLNGSKQNAGCNNFSTHQYRNVAGYEKDGNEVGADSTYLGLKYDHNNQQATRKEAKSYNHFSYSPEMIQDSNNFAVPARSNLIFISSKEKSPRSWSRASASDCMSPTGSVCVESPLSYQYSNSRYHQKGRQSVSLSTPFSARKRLQEYPMVDRTMKKEEISHIKPKGYPSNRFPASNHQINRKGSDESLGGRTKVDPRYDLSFEEQGKVKRKKIQSQDSFPTDAKLFGYTCLSSIILFITFYTLPPFCYLSFSLRSAMGATTSSLSLFFLSIMISYHLSLHRRFLETEWKRLSTQPWFTSSKNILVLLFFSYCSSAILSPIVFNFLWILDRRVPFVGGFLVIWLMGISTLCVWITAIIYTYRLGNNITKAFFTTKKTRDGQDEFVDTHQPVQPKLSQTNRTAVHTSVFQDFKNGKFGFGGMKNKISLHQVD